MEDKHSEDEKHEEVEDIESDSGDSFIVDSESDEPSISGQDDGLHLEEHLTEEEIEELIAEFLEVESKAAEAQEALELESLVKLKNEVREELAQALHGDDLEAAVEDEMTVYKEQWEAALDELETESAHLLEQLDGAGIELPSLYRLIENQVPNGCCTEAWKRRAHWVGSQVTSEMRESIAGAEDFLQTERPVRRRHGKLLEEGASGFLQKKIANDGSENGGKEVSDINWNSVNKIFSGDVSEKCAAFGSKHWASVYLASTPQQAAAMGLKFPGVDEVEEIEDVDGNSDDPFVADAIANEKELALSEEQRKKFRKVKEEDDANMDRKLQLHLKRRRHQKRSKQKEIGSVDWTIEDSAVETRPLVDASKSLSNKKTDDGDMPGNNNEVALQNLETGVLESSVKERSLSNGISSVSDSALPDSSELRGIKRSNESEEPNSEKKRSRTIIIGSDEADVVKDECSTKLEDHSVSPENINDAATDNSLHSQSLSEKFYCTACNNVAIEVHPHPILNVIVCKDCKCLLEKKMHVKDADCSECYCVWCGRSSDLVSCKSCKTLFCTTCVKRNISEACLSDEVQASCWQCCCCSPSLLKRLTSELGRAMGSENLIVSSSESDSENSDADNNLKIGGKRKQKKKIRRILDDAELGEETKRKIAIEKERQERLKSLQVQFSSKSKLMNSVTLDGDLSAGASIEVLGDAITGYIVNVVREKGEEAVRIPSSISAKLKAHQVVGIRFMWENIIQSIRKVKSGDKGLGCILAHTMGLGKTFQVIAFLYTAMRSVDLGLRTALIVTPVNVLHNWKQEFMKWRPSELKPLRVFMLEDVSRDRRAELLAKWRAKGGVFLIGYTAFRNLSFGKHVKDRNMAREICHALQDGPDILVCDEAHMIKNTRADTTQALKQVKCQRRIALTGSPLQNNLMEYYCMVDFVREGFLGSSHEFRNRFQNPIENGQHTNSTSEDVKIMNQRSHILYEQLKGFVQRMDMNVVKKDLPPKTVFVITVKLSPLQRRLYKRFLDLHGFTNDRVSNEKIRKSFFAGYQALAQIWNHPGILQLTKDKGYPSREDAEDSSSDENMDYNVVIGEKPRNMNDFLQGKNDDGFFQKDWWNDLLHDHTYKELDYSGKMVLLLDILTMCSNMGDKSLVFSQSIPTLDLIEFYLSKLPRPGKQGKLWKKGKDWYRLDGRTESSERQKLVERFNEPLNKRVKCTLISTRAGSLGINLHSANRVIIVDGSWNPTYDLQAIYRAWRYGQRKPVFAYRLMAHGTMEEKIYKRQVTKEGLAARVVDRQQVHRTISKEEMLHLFEFGDDENPDPLTAVSKENGQGSSQNTNCALKHKLPLSHEGCSDKLMESLLGKHHPRWISNYHEHETLLQENEEERLSKEEQDMAWEVFRKSLEWEEVQRVTVDESISERKPASMSNLTPAPETSSVTQPRGILRSHVVIRKCTNLSHKLTLRSQGTKPGCSTVCGECAQEISWENCKVAR
ncbi:protein CHROMATIN REMODELING 20 [Citrus sinensis]|uniref:protein CHROMATIN REMODELING 20 isoform X1 n=3 Tax=Citrus TaxID=2706 RepID=UPI0003D72097|nr:protein CHROMATIN REMODELING 20 isoform X1 [Citrus x clementina]XP_024041505.1 protein CHROMATIN REMODELING 20 isoform X1 [Citrus x clementina]XP_024041506.1 protein CHROMATIN REMODELING 20 isoform X1 [Citrus x clementina]XP_024041507.1 protein CHROMATIN REMODELING 20 isoform X1 [Citrus x clementina]XP_024041508.1 protein CHROMATIN REMODELING 20 isoform X1 [Citrus x clementina]XP_024041509.1 protein CHROMATIN REMODELING 20 isoform X1 [Citrus x clementina]XP_024041510.1 protein CHROMATIN RE